MAGSTEGEFRRGWRVLLTACIGLAFSLVTVPYYSLSQFIAPLQAEFGWPPAQIGIAATILTVSLFLTGPHMGRFVDRVGVRRLLLPSTLLVALCMATLTLIRGSVWSLYAGYVLISIAGAATTHVAYSRVITTWFDRSRGLALGITMAGAGVTAFVMPLLLSRVIGEYGWRAGILTCAVVMLLPLPLLYRYLHERDAAAPSAASAVAAGDSAAAAPATAAGLSAADALRTRQFWTMVAATALLSPAIQVAVVHMMPMLGGLGLTAAEAAKTASLLGLGIIVGRFLSGTLLDRLPGPVVGFTLFMIPVAGFLILYAQSAALAPLAVALVGVSIGVEGDILAYFTARYFGLRSYAEIFGWVFGVMCITGAAGPLLVLAMPADQGYGPLLLMFSGMVVIAAVLLGTLGRYPAFAAGASAHMSTRAGPATALALAATAWLAAPSATAGTPPPSVLLATGAAPGQPSVAADAREGFVVTWQERDGDAHALRYAVLDRDGRERRRGLIARGTNWFVNWADFPSLAVLDNGDWVTHWLVRNGDAPEAYDIRVVRSRDRGRSWSAAVLPHDDGTQSQHGFVSLVPAGGDRVLAVWLDGRRGAVDHVSAASKHSGTASSDEHAHGDTMSLRSVLLDRAGVVAEAARELDDSTCSCCQTDALRAGGRTLVVYRDRTPDEIRDISVLELSRQGDWLAPRNLYPDGWRIEGCPVNGPAIAANGARVLVIWPTGAGGEMRTRFVVRDAAALTQQGPMQELAGGARVLGRVDAAALGRSFVVSWLGQADGAQGSALRLARITRDGRLEGEQVVAELPASRISGNPRLASLGDRALLAWVQPAAAGRDATLHVALLRPEFWRRP